MAFQPAFNARLINEVKKHPCLYNHSRRGSGDTMERQRLWDSIAKNIDPNCAAEFAKKRWLQLRDRYRKELKIAIKNNFVAPVRWCYFSQLSWLDPYLKDNIGQVADDGKKSKMENFEESPSPFGWFDFSNLATIKDEIDEDDSDPALETSMLDRLLASATQRLESVSPEFENDESGPQSVEGRIEADTENHSPPPSRITPHDTIEEKTRDPTPPPPTKASVESLIAANQARFAHHLAIQLSGMSHSASQLNASKKSESAATPQHVFGADGEQQTAFNHQSYRTARQQRQNNLGNADQIVRHNLEQVGRVALEWLNDEDLLYSRIIGLKLKKMEPKKRKRMREQIMALLDESDDADNDDSCSSHSPSARDHDEECGIVETELSITGAQ